MVKIPLSILSALISRRQVLASLAGLLLVRFAGRAAIAAPEPFSIFFALNSTDVGESAMKIIALIRGLIKPNTRTVIVGHCDTLENEPDKLSLARANAVQAALTSSPLPPGATVSASGKGTAEPKKPTGPNASEPLNRYVSIILQ